MFCGNDLAFVKYNLSAIELKNTNCVLNNKMQTSLQVFFFLNSVLRPFQDYFSSRETGQSVGRRKRENPEENHLTHPQAELGLSHMCPERGSNPHQTQR